MLLLYLMLSVRLIFHPCPQPGDALLSAASPQQRFFSTFVQMDAELTAPRAVHVIEEGQALGPPGAPEGPGQQADVLARQHRRGLHVKVISCQSD